jgi:hypothetical protein
MARFYESTGSSLHSVAFGVVIPKRAFLNPVYKTIRYDY